MRLFSKEEIISLRNYVNTVNEEYKKNAYDRNSNLGISSKKVKDLNNLNRIISSKYR